ncbi:MAG: helix-turn-helix domain-containing protein [Pseudomonadales bacterium]|jgi:AcrR family transcriptional regulator|nr:helix-turn-helix domain-containing protein [Pseudomonadales bacterium]MDP6470293.1 helix-turn-helix domain-containing protein [Pseudomonadales bacterium]MDP6827199.1 helix-turn-helix domain-containing protein [Pseudomonadales bacterium]MDP6972499.1 helix-turn-helix domain-containing protein [Pseudomonadales bacterium]|tara:strand:- start:732 stop:1370 length:639 start_codon:yes stop_codon:yes gene_type:complete
MGVAERRERERQARKEAVLDAARRLLLEKGFRGTTTKEIAELCELSEATLFFYFKNKDEILLSLLFESIRFWADGFQRLERSRQSTGKRLEQIWRFHEKVNDEHPEYYVVSAYLAQPNTLQGVSPEIKEQITESSGANFQRLAKLLEDITGRSDGQHMADTLWSTFLGLMILRGSRVNLGHEDIRTGLKDRTAAFQFLKRGFLSEFDNRDRP